MWSCTICVTGQYKHVLGEPSSAQLLTNTVIQAHRYWLMMLWRQWAANLSFHLNLQIIKMLEIKDWDQHITFSIQCTILQLVHTMTDLHVRYDNDEIPVWCLSGNVSMAMPVSCILSQLTPSSHWVPGLTAAQAAPLTPHWSLCVMSYTRCTGHHHPRQEYTLHIISHLVSQPDLCRLL